MVEDRVEIGATGACKTKGVEICAICFNVHSDETTEALLSWQCPRTAFLWSCIRVLD
jgi:hypothetical protein